MPKQTFEGALKRLEQIVEALESGDLPLEKAIKKFEEGVQLSTLCTRQLEETEKRVEILLKNEAGDRAAEPFLGEDDIPEHG
ncbi:MAG: exodeoxyribonuclease VII small subunit [Desulfobacterales bacterium]